MWNPLTRLFKRNKKLSEQWIREASANCTPDLISLETKSHHRVFFCDEYMKPHFMFTSLKGSVYRGNGITLEDFSCFKRDVGVLSEVIPLRAKYPWAPFCPIRGQLWKIPTDLLIKLDVAKFNGIRFKRTKVSLAIPHHDPKTGVREVNMAYEAWMYVGVHEHWHEMLSKGSKIIYRKDGEITTQGRIYESMTYLPIKTYIPNSKILKDLGERYYYYSDTEYK